MRRLILTFSLVVIFLFAGLPPASGQTAGGVSVLGRDGRLRSRITDGDSIQLRATLPVRTEQAAPVEFHLEGLDQPVAACTVSAGEDSCLSDLFPALGWYWLPGGVAAPGRVVTARVNGQKLPGEAALQIAPRPVVMVHGFISSWETWQAYLGPGGYLASLGLQGFAVGDGQFPGVLNTGDPAQPAQPTNSIAQNAAILGEYIAAVQQKTGAEQVDLLVHSMGGMISRYYLDRVMQTDNVAQLIFLGTPQSGSACVFPLAALGYLLPASIEIQPSYMDGVFNQQITHRRGVPFHLVAGTRLLEPISSPCTNVPSDTVVGFDSATSIPLDSIARIPTIHGDLTANPAVFSEAVKGLLQSAPQAFEPRSDPAAAAQTSAPEQFSRAFTGHLNPGETQEITVPIDPEVALASFNLYDASHSLQIEVRGASGKVIQLDPQKNGLIQVEDPAMLIYLGYGFAKPKPGAWVVKLMTTAETPASGADFALTARYTGGATLEAQTNPTIPELGQPVSISARLLAAGQIVSVDSAQALIRRPDGGLETVQLDSAGEQFTAIYQPSAPGLYSVSVLLAGKTTQGQAIDRAAYLSFEVAPDAQTAAQGRSRLAFWGLLGGSGLAVLCAASLLLGFVLLGWLWWRGRRPRE